MAQASNPPFTPTSWSWSCMYAACTLYVGGSM